MDDSRVDVVTVSNMVSKSRTLEDLGYMVEGGIGEMTELEAQPNGLPANPPSTSRPGLAHKDSRMP